MYSTTAIVRSSSVATTDVRNRRFSVDLLQAVRRIATWRPSRKPIRTSDRRARSGVKRSTATLMTSGWRLAQSASTTLADRCQTDSGWCPPTGACPGGWAKCGRRSPPSRPRTTRGTRVPGSASVPAWHRAQTRVRRPEVAAGVPVGQVWLTEVDFATGLQVQAGNEQIVLQRWLLRAGPGADCRGGEPSTPEGTLGPARRTAGEGRIKMQAVIS